MDSYESSCDICMSYIPVGFNLKHKVSCMCIPNPQCFNCLVIPLAVGLQICSPTICRYVKTTYGLLLYLFLKVLVIVFVWLSQFDRWYLLQEVENIGRFSSLSLRCLIHVAQLLAQLHTQALRNEFLRLLRQLKAISHVGNWCQWVLYYL